MSSTRLARRKTVSRSIMSGLPETIGKQRAAIKDIKARLTLITRMGCADLILLHSCDRCDSSAQDVRSQGWHEQEEMNGDNERDDQSHCGAKEETGPDLAHHSHQGDDRERRVLAKRL